METITIFFITLWAFIKSWTLVEWCLIILLFVVWRGLGIIRSELFIISNQIGKIDVNVGIMEKRGDPKIDYDL